MVEMWEMEWNSSMIQHGADLGTMEFIFAKGGTLRDFNYVLLNQHDDTWEPLIKAVAERDNSHPDIIRKQAQQPFGINPQTFQGAVPVNLAGGVQTAATGKRQMRDLLAAQRVNQANTRVEDARAAGQQPRGRDLATRGQRMAGLAQGVRNIAGEQVAPAAQATGRAIMSGAQAGYQGMRAGAGAAKDFAQNTAMPAMRAGAQRAGEGLQAAGRGIAAGAGKARDYLSQKFPGVKQRMGQFMQGAKNVGRGVADFARHGVDAYFGEKDATGKRQGGTRARNVMQRADQNEMDRLRTTEQRKIDRHKQRATSLATPGIRAKEAEAAQKRQDAIDAEQKTLSERMKRRGPTTGLGGLREQVRRLAQKRRDANQPETALDPAIFDAAKPVEEQMQAGPAEEAMADSTMPADDEITEADLPSTEMPTPEAPKPQPVDDLVEEEAPPMTRGQELAMGAVRAAKYSGAENEPSKYRGSTQTQYGNVGGMDFDNMTHEDLQSKFKMHIPKQKAMFEYLVNELGLSPAEAAKEVETTEVEVPDDDEITADDLLLENQTLLSENKYEVKGWDALLKRLDVR